MLLQQQQQQDPHHNVVESSTSSSGDVQQVIDNGTAADAAAETTTIESCTFSLPRHHYVVYYVADLVLFYVTPLLVACVLYALIGRTLLGRRGGVGRTSSTAALTRRDAGGADRTLHEAPVGRYGSVATAAAAAAAGRGGSSNRNGVVVVLHRPSTTAAAADRSHRKGVAAVETTMPTMHRGSCCVNGDSGGGLQVSYRGGPIGWEDSPRQCLEYIALMCELGTESFSVRVNQDDLSNKAKLNKHERASY